MELSLQLNQWVSGERVSVLRLYWLGVTVAYFCGRVAWTVLQRTFSGLDLLRTNGAFLATQPMGEWRTGFRASSLWRVFQLLISAEGLLGEFRRTFRGMTPRTNGAFLATQPMGEWRTVPFNSQGLLGALTRG
jgi:hypothetical protein